MTQKKETAPLTLADVQKLIDDALAQHGADQSKVLKNFGDSVEERFTANDKAVGEKFDAFAAEQGKSYEDFVAKMPDTILGVVKDTNLFADRITDEVANHFAEADFSKPFDAAVAKLGLTPDNLGQLVDAAMDSRAARDADKAAAAEKGAAAAQEKESARLVSADKAAAKKLEVAEKAKADAAQKRVDRASRDYRALIEKPVPSKLTPETARTITLRLGDGSTFHPEHELTLGSAELHHESDRLVNSQVIPLPADFSPFTASEAILIVEGGKEPVALYRSPIESALRFGGGASAQLAVGALAFRRLSPEPEAASA